MSHVNISIPQFTEVNRALYMSQLEGKAKFWEAQANLLTAELMNIPDAIKDHGYVYLQGVELDKPLHLVERPTKQEVSDLAQLREAATKLASAIAKHSHEISAVNVVAINDIDSECEALDLALASMVGRERTQCKNK